MQAMIDFDNLFDFSCDSVVLNPVAMVWLKNHQWQVIFRWHHLHIDRRMVRSRRILDKSFPNGISQFDFMKVHIK